jgi:hypothetical protein
MAPAVGIKRGSAASQAVVALPPTDARLAVRDVIRSTIPAPSPAEAPAERAAAAPAAAMAGFLCLEEVDGRRWSYVVDGGAAAGKGKGRGVSTGSPSVRAVPMQSPLPPAEVSARSTPRFGAGHGLEGLIAGVGNYLHHLGDFTAVYSAETRACALVSLVFPSLHPVVTDFWVSWLMMPRNRYMCFPPS